MLTIGMENFQSVRTMQEVPLSGITLVYGNNSSGKSIIKDALEMGLNMHRGPAFNSPPEKWINFRARENSEPVRLAYCFAVSDAYGDKNYIIEHMISDSLVDGGFGSIIDVDTDNEYVSLLSEYLVDSLVRVEYEWHEEGFSGRDEKYDTKTEIGLGRIGDSGLVELEVFAEVYSEQEGALLISFNKNHELIRMLLGGLEVSSFISGKDLREFALEPDGVFFTNPIMERYRWSKADDFWGENESDVGYILAFFSAIGIHHFVSEASKIKYIGDIREGKERLEGDRYAGEEYWEKLKALVLEEKLESPSFMGELVRINKWLGEPKYLNSGYKLCGDFKFLVGMDEFKSVKENGFSSLVSRVSDVGGLQYSKLMLKDIASGQLIDFSDVGTGVSQVLPILYYMSLSGFFGGSVYIQQPELHLHPRLQASMAQIFIDSFITNDKARNYIIETHSELIVLRMLKVIRKNYETKNLLKERALLADDVNVIFAVKDEKGVTAYKHLRISKNGDFLDKWPEGFFEERDQELF
ncbi:DUF3696 domain-containing protein [Halopseudomonas sp. Lyrl_26]|uniref:DUF3696 domain-containing protein n=1 Tax=Halopseudomonas sp. Lyrl_26 TaxID=3110923 RepID=UPI003F7EE46B